MKFQTAYKNIINGRRNAYSISKYLYNAINATKENTIISEGIDYEFAKDKTGGIITFSTQVNAVKLTDNMITNWIRKKFETFKNKFTANSKIDEIAKKFELQGWTVGKFLSGRYTDKNGNVYDENSLSLEVIGIDKDTLISLAEEICKAFMQESVLVKSYSDQTVFLVSP